MRGCCASLVAPFAPVAEAVVRYGEAIRFLAGRESTPVLVRGPMSLGSYLNYPKHQQAMEARIRQTDAELATLCGRYRVPYYSMVKLTAPDPLRYLGDDLTYLNAAGHHLQAEQELQVLMPLFQQP